MAKRNGGQKGWLKGEFSHKFLCGLRYCVDWQAPKDAGFLETTGQVAADPWSCRSLSARQRGLLSRYDGRFQRSTLAMERLGFKTIL
jgi:hypothetical protein